MRESKASLASSLVVLAVLATMSLACGFKKYQCKSKQSEAQVDLAMASVSMEMYKTENGKYPSTMSELEGAGFSPERLNYDYVITEVHEDSYVLTAVGQGDMVGDIWEVTEAGTTTNVDNACD